MQYFDGWGCTRSNVMAAHDQIFMGLGKGAAASVLAPLGAILLRTPSCMQASHKKGMLGC